MSYTVLISKRAERDLEALAPPTQNRLRSRIRALADDPFPPGRKKLAGQSAGNWRIRVGDFRVLYTVQQETVTILVLRVRNRKDAY